MKKHIMKTDLTIKVRATNESESVHDIIIPKGWEYLESTSTKDNRTYSIFKWGYVHGADQYISRIILVTGEWNLGSDQPNKYFVRGSISTRDSQLHKLQTFKSVQDLVDKICEDTDKWYAKNDYVAMYPEFQRYGIRPTEVEIEEMDRETRAKYPKRINQL